MPELRIGSTKFFYRISESLSTLAKPIIVFLHGSGGEGTVWENQQSLSEDNITAIIVDLPGHGNSDGPPLGRVMDYAQWLDALSYALELSSFFLAGHSFGGAIAQEFAHTFAPKVKGLILVGSGTMLKSSENYLATVKDNFQAAIQASCQMAFSPGIPSELYAKGFELLSRTGQQILYNDIITAAAFNSKPWIRSIKVPALIICGSEDKITPPQLSADLAKSLPRGDLKLIAGAGHMVMMEAPEAFNACLKDFIRKQQPSNKERNQQ
jgi:pimeloyl-ACP methyl ester carboxylesterase